ncbi:MAG: twin-arginine translocation signal domain-containing protein [Pirellulales bacterium]|nr:twin-arginine translocation signal domain-containing protein [Pirellulales bacterium]
MSITRRSFIRRTTAAAASVGFGSAFSRRMFGAETAKSPVRLARIDDRRAFSRVKAAVEADNPGIRLSLVEIDGEKVLRSAQGGMRIFWLYRGAGEVFLPKGYRTQEGDGEPLPAEYKPEKVDAALADAIEMFEKRLASVAEKATVPVQAIVDRCKDGAFRGNIAGDLWTLEHAPRPWSTDKQMEAALAGLFRQYREIGFSFKQVDSFEAINAGDQLIAVAEEGVRVRGRFECLSMEKVDRTTSHESAVRRLRHLMDTAGGCNPDFDPFRRLPLTWYPLYPGESGDGVNWVNSHVVNIPKETSPTHFHPPKAVGGSIPQREMYLVLDPKSYKLNTWGRTASLIVYPDLRDLRRYEQHHLEPGTFVYIPPGTGHRGLDVFVNVLTIPGFKPHNEYYIDRDVRDLTEGKSPYNENLLDIKNYRRIEDFL